MRADLVTYGNTLGGGPAVGVLCGRRALMKRFRENSAVDICFARSTFNAHPYVMGTMLAFLPWLERLETRALNHGLDQTWDAGAAELNACLVAEDLPVRAANL